MSKEKAELMLDALRKFNRKERYHLIRKVVIGRPMGLQDDFKKSLESELGIRIPQNPYVAMDYHLDWISAAYHLGSKGVVVEDAVRESRRYSNYPGQQEDGLPLLSGNQEDVDLLVAFREKDQVVLILIEAKLDSGWSGEQLASKGNRLDAIFKKGQASSSLVRPYFVLMGPSRSDEKSMGFDDNSIDQCPTWFFRGKKSAGNLFFVPLNPDVPLYAPTRKKNDDDNSERYSNWIVQKRLVSDRDGE
ncbi:hypothetical protein J2T60_001605 [Natronospira proteinivora]|uniref:Uncharacterized protein n=1 Tax=Natronospira proteinivora TaxID=1807133 RepID=A0ABT1G8I6_9GAMM|nr:hypothetical protein [Natronospira proteinivora]MCP1727605.1 hypothetical protein [Natronospira proteinivora]